MVKKLVTPTDESKAFDEAFDEPTPNHDDLLWTQETWQSHARSDVTRRSQADEE